MSAQQVLEPQALDRQQLRSMRHLRLVSSDEEGSALRDLPGGVYGFTYSPNTEGCPLFAKQTFQVFEVHKLSDGSVHFIGYMTPAEAETLAQSNDPVELKLYPEPHGEAQQLVSVPFDRILKAKPVSRENGNWMPFRLAPRL